jgi:hypothetical protein
VGAVIRSVTPPPELTLSEFSDVCHSIANQYYPDGVVATSKQAKQEALDALEKDSTDYFGALSLYFEGLAEAGKKTSAKSTRNMLVKFVKDHFPTTITIKGQY